MNLLEYLRAGPPFDVQTWSTNEEGEINQIGSLSPSCELWFLRNLGQVLLTTSTCDMEISWDTGQVQETALDIVKNHLDDLDYDLKIHLNFFYHGWVNEVFWDTFSALERIDEIQECKSVALLHETRLKTCPLSDINFANRRIKEGFHSWERSKGDFATLDQSDYAKFLPKILIFRPDEREENIVYSWVGSQSTAAQVNSTEWVEKSIGEVTHQAFGNESQVFTDKINRGIAQTLLTGEPLYQHIRTLVRLEDQEPFWMPYERLLTRHVLHDGRPAVFSDVFPTQYVDVSLASGP